MSVLVTGGTGYIGSHTCVELMNSGHDVVIVDNLSNSSPGVVERIENITGKQLTFYPVDVRDTSSLEHLFHLHDIEAIIHFAGVKAVAESVVNPLKYYSNNVRGSIALFETAARHNVKRVVFSSSATVYGNVASSPLREEMPAVPDNTYGRSKRMVEEYLTDLSRADPIWRTVILRYFNPVGAHPSGLIGEDSVGVPSNLMPFVCQVSSGRRAELVIFGRDYPTPDGTAIRDYIHVMDLARGHVHALQATVGADSTQIINLGTGRGTSVLELVETFERVNGVTIPYRYAGRRSGDATVTYADPTLATEKLNWRACLTLEDMCRDAWRWQRLNPDGYARTRPAYVQEKRAATVGAIS